MLHLVFAETDQSVSLWSHDGHPCHYDTFKKDCSVEREAEVVKLLVDRRQEVLVVAEPFAHHHFMPDYFILLTCCPLS